MLDSVISNKVSERFIWMGVTEANKYISAYSTLLDDLLFHIKLVCACDSQPGKQSSCKDVN